MLQIVFANFKGFQGIPKNTPLFHSGGLIFESFWGVFFGVAKTQQGEIRSITYASNRVRQFREVPGDPPKKTVFFIRLA